MMATIAELSEMRRIYDRYKRGRKVDSADIPYIEKLGACNSLVMYIKDGDVWAMCPYI